MIRHKDEEVQLPSKLSVPSDNLSDYTMLLYGEKKVGKTSLAAQFPKALFLMCEPGGKALRIYQMPITKWEHMRSAIKALQKDKEFRTVIIDTVDIAYRLCMEYVCTKLAIEHPSDEDWGKGWQAVRDEWADAMNKLLSLGKGVIFISHAMEAEIKTRSGSSYHKVTPTVSKQARDLLEACVDIWAYYAPHGERRELIIRGDDHIGAGTRLATHFLTPDGRQVHAVPMGRSAEEAYRNYTSCFANKLDVARSKDEEPSKVASKTKLSLKNRK